MTFSFLLDLLSHSHVSVLLFFISLMKNIFYLHIFKVFLNKAFKCALEMNLHRCFMNDKSNDCLFMFHSRLVLCSWPDVTWRDSETWGVIFPAAQVWERSSSKRRYFTQVHSHVCVFYWDEVMVVTRPSSCSFVLQPWSNKSNCSAF